MTAIEFIMWAEGYYGKYPDGQKKDIWEYIKGLSPQYFDALKDAVMRRYSSKWGRPPDIAIFEEYREIAENKMLYQDYLPAPEEDLISPEEAKRLAESFGKIIKAKGAK